MTEVAYRLIARGAKAKMEQNAAERDAMFREVELIAKRALKLRKPLSVVASNGTSGIRVMGFDAPTKKEKTWSDRVVDRPYAPEGWMLIEPKSYPGGPYYIVPKRNTKVGKELYAKLKIDERFPSVLQMFGGMPHRIMVPEAPHHVLSPGWQMIGGKLYVTWNGDPERDTFMKRSEDPGPAVDPKIWKRVPLSEYYAAVEKHAA